MGLLDDLSDGINRGIGSADRALQAGRIKSTISHLSRSRDELLLSLGHHVYAVSRRQPVAVEGVDELFARIREIEMQIATQQSELDTLSAAPAVATVACASCGAPNPMNAAFCVGCGNRLVVVSTTKCPHCGGGLAEGAKFCTRCGSSVDAPAAQAAIETPPAPPVPAEPAPVAAAAEDAVPAVSEEPAPAAVEEPASAEPAASASVIATTVYCTSCGSAVDSSQAFCPFCGMAMR